MIQPIPDEEAERIESVAYEAFLLMTLNVELNSDDALELAEMIVDGLLA